jgi:hypothetical protein
MAKPTTTPFGHFPTRGAAYDFISHYHIVEFVLMFPQYVATHGYKPWMNFRGNGKNCAARHYVGAVMRHELLGKVQGWQ